MGEFPNKETQFKAGNGGRPKGARNRSTIYREFIEQQAVKSLNKRLDAALGECKLENAPKTIEEQIVASIVLSALSGDVAAAREIMDSAYGKLTDKVETKHSFTAMGKVMAVPAGASDETQGVELVFNVGEAVTTPEDLNDEGEKEDEQDNQS